MKTIKKSQLLECIEQERVYLQCFKVRDSKGELVISEETRDAINRKGWTMLEMLDSLKYPSIKNIIDSSIELGASNEQIVKYLGNFYKYDAHESYVIERAKHLINNYYDEMEEEDIEVLYNGTTEDKWMLLLNYVEIYQFVEEEVEYEHIIFKTFKQIIDKIEKEKEVDHTPDEDSNPRRER